MNPFFFSFISMTFHAIFILLCCYAKGANAMELHLICWHASKLNIKTKYQSNNTCMYMALNVKGNISNNTIAIAP